MIVWPTLPQPESKCVAIEASGGMSLPVLLSIIQKHLVALNQSCFSKLRLSSYDEGFNLSKTQKPRLPTQRFARNMPSVAHGPECKVRIHLRD